MSKAPCSARLDYLRISLIFSIVRMKKTSDLSTETPNLKPQSKLPELDSSQRHSWLTLRGRNLMWCGEALNDPFQVKLPLRSADEKKTVRKRWILRINFFYAFYSNFIKQITSQWTIELDYFHMELVILVSVLIVSLWIVTCEIFSHPMLKWNHPKQTA